MSVVTRFRCDGCGIEADAWRALGGLGPYVPPQGWYVDYLPTLSPGEFYFGPAPKPGHYCPACHDKIPRRAEFLPMEASVKAALEKLRGGAT